MEILPFSHTNSVEIKIPTAQRHLDQKTRLQKFQPSISPSPRTQPLCPIYILDRLIKLYRSIYLLIEYTVERPRFGGSKADCILLGHGRNFKCAHKTPPPKRGPPSKGWDFVGALGISIMADFFQGGAPTIWRLQSRPYTVRQHKSGQHKDGQHKVGSTKMDSTKMGSTKMGNTKVGSTKPGSTRISSIMMDSIKLITDKSAF